MKTGEKMQFWLVLAEAEDNTTIVVTGLDNHLRISGPNDLGCGANALVKVYHFDTTIDGRPLVWVQVLEDTTAEDDEEAINAYLDAHNIWWDWEEKPQEPDTMVVWAIRKEKKA